MSALPWWSVWWGTSWWVVAATDDAAARQASLGRMHQLARYHLPTRPMGPAERDALRAEFLSRLVVRPASEREVETYRLLGEATTAQGGASARLRALQLISD